LIGWWRWTPTLAALSLRGGGGVTGASWPGGRAGAMVVLPQGTGQNLDPQNPAHQEVLSAGGGGWRGRARAADGR